MLGRGCATPLHCSCRCRRQQALPLPLWLTAPSPISLLPQTSVKLLIDGQFVESKTKDWIDVRNPATQVRLLLDSVAALFPLS
jgi:hypothetical protein